MDTLLLSAHRLSSSSSSSSSSFISGEESLSLSSKIQAPVPPPPLGSPPPDMTPPPPPGLPPPVDAKRRPKSNTPTDKTSTQKTSSTSVSRSQEKTLLTTTRCQASPVKQRCAEAFTTESVQDDEEQEDEEEDDHADAYSDESDVFEEDMEAILFAEEEEDRRKGYKDCLMETHLDSAEYPYPAYLNKLATLFTEQSALGKNPEDFIYCNNLLVSPSQLKLLNTRTAALEREKWAQVRKSAALKAKEEEARRSRERLVEALEPPAKRIKISEATIKALESKQYFSASSLRPFNKSSRKRSRKKPAAPTASTAPATPASSSLLVTSKGSSKKARTKPSSLQTAKVNGKAIDKPIANLSIKKKTTALSSRAKKGTTNATPVTSKAVATDAKAIKAAKKEQVKQKAMLAASNIKEVRVQAQIETNRFEADVDRGNESSSSSSSVSSSSSSCSSSSSSSSSVSFDDDTAR